LGGGLSITLTGFKGIRSGLGRETLTLDLEALAPDAQLVAIAGANGRGKTTLLDNLHPYLVMPSRAGADGLGSFSYYDHVYLPESQKVLEWSQAGRRYKTHLVFRVNGKRKTEAFLFVRHGGAWRPVELRDGTPTDGKVDTYERAVGEVLGPPETFFTSAFSAQGKRPLSAYRNGEIKALLADLLGLEGVRATGALAAETVRLLKAGLGMIRADLATAVESVARLERQRAGLNAGDGPLEAARAAKRQAAEALEQAQVAAAQVAAEFEATFGVEQRRARLTAERNRLAAQYQRETEQAAEQQRILAGRRDTLRRRASARRAAFAVRRGELLQRRDLLTQTLALADDVARAARRAGRMEGIVRERAARVAAAQASVERFERLREAHALRQQELAGLETQAGQVALRQTDLARRFGLAGQVPCAGMDLQGACPLLQDAHEAKGLQPGVDMQLSSLRERQQSLRAALKATAEEMVPLRAAADQRNRAEQRHEASLARQTALHLTAARQGEVAQAQLALEVVTSQLAALGEQAPAETADEAEDRQAIEAAEEGAKREAALRLDASSMALARVQAELATLPAPIAPDRQAAAREAVAQRTRALRGAEAAEIAAVRSQEQLQALQAQLNQARASGEAAQVRAVAVERELGAWHLLAQALSNDGVIALDIDDAGPTLAALANDLLLACYGPRYTLVVITQSATAKGDLREDFDIVVHDGWRAESKSLKLVSSGERVWINECLTRAIALYLANNTGRPFGTLFSDEADGPLDPAHKRMFMTMKREVLRLGGYAREFYVSQTPELTALADATIDLDALSAKEERA